VQATFQSGTMIYLFCFVGIIFGITEDFTYFPEFFGCT